MIFFNARNLNEYRLQISILYILIILISKLSIIFSIFTSLYWRLIIHSLKTNFTFTWRANFTLTLNCVKLIHLSLLFISLNYFYITKLLWTYDSYIIVLIFCQGNILIFTQHKPQQILYSFSICSLIFIKQSFIKRLYDLISNSSWTKPLIYLSKKLM